MDVFDIAEASLMTFGGTPNTPEMDVQGKGVSIANGDTTPDAADDTDYGSAYIGNTTQHTFTIQNTGDADLTLWGTPIVDIIGAHPADFSVTADPTSPVAPFGGTATFTA